MMIEVSSLQKEYGDKLALKGIDFSVADGEVFGFLGPNGAGKTTTLKILAGQLQPTGGQATILGMDVTTQKQVVQLNIGFVPEKTNLYERLTVAQNLQFFCRLYNCKADNMDEYLHKVDLLKEKNTPVKQLSKGMKQKVLLVRALLHRPKLLFLDEPTSGLDPTSADNMHRILQDINKAGTTVFLTSHNMEEVEKLCHRVAFLNEGRIVAQGSPEELKLQYADRTLRVLLDDGSKEEKVLDMDCKETSTLVSCWLRHGKVRAIHSSEPTLADIFVKVTGRDF
ncbi:ABC transporter ATP-binding protein [Dethiobacter alkaliphilus]|uniref:ABC transporter related protein n=1 Tax=Dethiobacter alkaliphilus AHT 1 TaxID=555088 RepID=C0GFQ7_DETAL|nr:ABC transporter ATP-binding protein [Dethiobacter alkaliphilus]EEG78017.1 ABC transporter related protein [Dethiobacter alkaliphilus AHT 1]